MQKANGVMLPYEMAFACQLHVPLHRGNHANGTAGGVAYPAKITSDLKEYANDIKSGKDYDNGGIGCGGVKSVSEKSRNNCPQTRSHGLTKKGDAVTLLKNIMPLAIGK